MKFTRSLSLLFLTVLLSLNTGAQNLVTAGRFKILTGKHRETIYYIDITEAASAKKMSHPSEFHYVFDYNRFLEELRIHLCHPFHHYG